MPREPEPPAPCARCGTPNAPFGLGPPLVEEQVWLCHLHWLMEPSTQAFQREEALRIGEDFSAPGASDL